MSRQARRDTNPEMLLRRRLHALGWRYRVDAPLPTMPRRRADLIFPRQRVAVFVDGCFWHGCADHGTWPTSNADWWRDKILKNVARDRETDCKMCGLGWKVVRVWEHEKVDTAVCRVITILRQS